MCDVLIGGIAVETIGDVKTKSPVGYGTVRHGGVEPSCAGQNPLINESSHERSNGGSTEKNRVKGQLSGTKGAEVEPGESSHERSFKRSIEWNEDGRIRAN